MLVVAPGTAWFWRSTQARLNWLVPGCKGTVTTQPVTLLHVTGYSIPLNQMVLTAMGAVPVTMAVSLVITVELIAKATMLTPWLVKAERRELCIVAIQSSRPPDLAGFCTNRP